jgi:hypothetical protein
MIKAIKKSLVIKITFICFKSDTRDDEKKSFVSSLICIYNFSTNLCLKNVRSLEANLLLKRLGITFAMSKNGHDHYI